MAKKIETAAKAKTTAAKTTKTTTKEIEMTNAATPATATEAELLNEIALTQEALGQTAADTSTDTAAADTTPAEPAAPKATPKYLVQRAKRQRFSFGNTWINAVLAGVVSDQPKLVAHGVKLNAGTQAELEILTIEQLLPIVQEAIMNEPAPVVEPEATEPTAEAPAETEAQVPAVEAEAEEAVAA